MFERDTDECFARPLKDAAEPGPGRGPNRICGRQVHHPAIDPVMAVGDRFLGVRVGRFHGPKEPEDVRSPIASGNRRLSVQFDRSGRIGFENGFRFPDNHAGVLGGGLDCHSLAWPEPRDFPGKRLPV